MKALKCGSLIILLLLIVALVIFLIVAPAHAEKQRNRVQTPGPYTLPDKVKSLHDGLFIADLHADSLLWDRDLLKYNSYGHVDLPRLQAGNVALQMFTVVTKVPRDINIKHNSAQARDSITLLAMGQLWPVKTWKDLSERALYQAHKLHTAAKRSNDKLAVITSQQELEHFLKQRKLSPDMVGGLLGLEGAHALQGDLKNIDKLYAAGFRMIGLMHFFDNTLGGSAHGEQKGGLTAFGNEVIRHMNDLNMIVDVAHASPAMIDDVLRISRNPVISSHTGVKGTCNNLRNLSDKQIRGIARTGGLIGIGYWKTATCGQDARAIARAIRYTVDLVGVDYVALGSDFDGAVTTPFDASGIGLITEALLAENFSALEISKIMGGNTLQLLRHSLPLTSTTLTAS